MSANKNNTNTNTNTPVNGNNLQDILAALASMVAPAPAPAPAAPAAAAIEFHDTALCNERVLVFDIRQAILDQKNDTLPGLVKAWLHLANKRESTRNEYWKNDKVVRMFTSELVIAAQNVKGVSVKDKGVQAVLETLSSGMVKRILYSLLRQGGEFTRVEKKEETRPDEKTTKTRGTRTPSKRVADMTEEEYLEHMREIWKKKHETK